MAESGAGTPRPGGMVVGIGASAGGLEAFSAFFGAMPAHSGLAFVLVQHLSPDHKSMLVEREWIHPDTGGLDKLAML